jgi:hypothetical protein
MTGMLTGRPNAARPRTRPNSPRLRLVARVVSVAWAMVGAAAIVNDVVTTTPDDAFGQRLTLIGLGVLACAALAAIPWRWEAAGGALLLATGLLLLAGTVAVAVSPGMPPETLLFAIVIIAGSPLLAGALFVGCARAGRPDRTVP